MYDHYGSNYLQRTGITYDDSFGFDSNDKSVLVYRFGFVAKISISVRHILDRRARLTFEKNKQQDVDAENSCSCLSIVTKAGVCKGKHLSADDRSMTDIGAGSRRGSRYARTIDDGRCRIPLAGIEPAE